MSILNKLSFSASLLMFLSIPAFAGVIVNSPSNGADVSSPFALSADAAVCSSQSVGAIGYSLDNSTSTATVNGQSLNAQVTAGSGSHTVHVKAWGNSGAVCVTDVTVTVSAGAELVPSGSTSVSAVQALGDWIELHDPGTGGWSSGAMSVVNSPSRSGFAREFYTTYGTHGGERYHANFADDQAATNFLYDAWIYLTNSTSNLANLEMDLNQVMPNGQTAIFGMQCDGYSYTWDYTVNKGSATSPSDHWVHSSAPCNIRSWGRNAWHHIQLSYSRNDSGVVTYHAVYVDGKEEAINATVFSGFALGWAPTILTNFQVDGLGAAGSVTIYLDNLTVYRW